MVDPQAGSQSDIFSASQAWARDWFGAAADSMGLMVILESGFCILCG